MRDTRPDCDIDTHRAATFTRPASHIGSDGKPCDCHAYPGYDAELDALLAAPNPDTYPFSYGDPEC